MDDAQLIDSPRERPTLTFVQFADNDRNPQISPASGKPSKNASTPPLAGVSGMDLRLLSVQYLAHDDHQNFNFLFRLR